LVSRSTGLKVSGTALRVPKKPGGILLKTCKKRKTYTHSTAHAAMAPAAHQSDPNKTPPRARSASLEGSCPPRAKSASLEGSRSLEWASPRSSVPAFLERGPPRSRFPHERTCTRTRARAFNALTQQSRTTTRLGMTPRRCSTDSLGGAHPRHYGELCDEAGVSSVTLCRPL
jgi:hypothetical protein